MPPVRANRIRPFATYRVCRYRAYAIRPYNTTTPITNWDNHRYQGNHKGCPYNEHVIRDEKSVIKISECIVNNRRNCVGRSFRYSVVGFQRTVYTARTGDPCGRPKLNGRPQRYGCNQSHLPPVRANGIRPFILPICNIPHSPT